jgi:hypothetical protein
MLETFTRAPFLLKWTLANMLGWGLGFLLGGLLLNFLDGVLGLILASILTGTCVGLAQATLVQEPRWLLLSAVGGAAAIVPALISSITLAAGPLIGFAIIGALYGGIFGAVQWTALRHSDEFGLWIAVNAIAGGFCGCLTLNFNPLSLPLFCSIGPLVFGLLTGLLLRQLRSDDFGD